MAVRDIIHFGFGAQLSPRQLFPAPSPPEPVAESPPANNSEDVSHFLLNFDRHATHVPG
jgi:hypothetical protein